MTERASLWGLRLLALSLALLLWFFSSVEKRERIGEKVIDASVTYNPPRGLIILNPLQTVRIRLRGSDRRIRDLNPFLVDVRVGLGRAEKGPLEIHLGPENVMRPDGLEVATIEPNTVRLQLDNEVTQLLPVRPRVVGEPAGGAVPGEPRVQPESVMVSGPESHLRGILWLSTSPVSLNGHALEFEESVSVLTPDPLVRVMEPSVVKVRIPMAHPEFDERGAED